LTASAGEIWLADRGEETRRLVFVISDTRFHRLAERAVVAPVLDEVPASPRPWHVRLSDDNAIAVNQLGTMPIDRLLERVEMASSESSRQARRAVRAITS
jgi:mRNA-degrading endonuclease toxin of MazEF toxin-antitoxin module